MKGMVLRGIVRPLVERLGTMLGIYMISSGLDRELSAQLINATLAAVFILFDLVVSTVNRERDITRVFDDAAKAAKLVRRSIREDD